MTSSTEQTDGILSHLDDTLNTPYFIPLSPGDALAVQFRVEALKGLAVEDVRAVFTMIEKLDVEPEEGGNIDPDKATDAFFACLKNELPHIFEKWATADTDMILNPAGALELALERGAELINEWLVRSVDRGRGSETERALIIKKGVTAALTKSVPSTFENDRAFREYLRAEILPLFPVWAGPEIYLAAWSEYIKAILDLDPSPEIRDYWPY